MKIRRHLDPDETIYDLENYEELFLGGCCGVALVKRGKNDNHISLVNLTEDDGAWFVSGNSKSSYWIDDEIEVLKVVKEWLSTQADPDIHNGNQFGWKFKETP